jgi:hypothetical protein
MWQHVFQSHETNDTRDRLVIASHHPDRLRRPEPSPAAVADERFQQALIWNVFRTLELVTPSFWLRRFHLRLTGESSVVPPQIARVRLWQRLPLPPSQRIDGDRPDVIADVVIETEHEVWTLVVESARNQLLETDQAAALVDAGGWFAGARHHYCGVIESTAANTSLGSTLRTRYSRSHYSAQLRSATRGPASPTAVRWGAIRFSDLAALLKDCRDADNVAPIERALAQNALDWVMRAAPYFEMVDSNRGWSR